MMVSAAGEPEKGGIAGSNAGWLLNTQNLNDKGMLQIDVLYGTRLE